MCLFGTGIGHCVDWAAVIESNVMVEVIDDSADEGRCGGIGRGRAIVAIATIVKAKLVELDWQRI
jgi:hypothetical protein